MIAAICARKPTMNWKHDWLRFEAELIAGAVALMLVVYGVSRVVGWLSR